MEYYDKILAGIFGSLVTGAAVGAFGPLPLNMTLAGGSALSMGFMYHGMFRNAPVAVGGESL
ncbi:MAG: hypothetical protein SVU32_06975 [Candidatus Nanohaloarchaea archaeon]|nr:hypothetical protein [Candidatus Nanohaloarchaea archaeon]